MRTAKRQLTLALCSALTLITASACDSGNEKTEKVGESKTDTKTPETKKPAAQATGSMELRMVDVSELSARMIPDATAMKEMATKAEITIKAIAVRRCIADDEDDKDDKKAKARDLVAQEAAPAPTRPAQDKPPAEEATTTDKTPVKEETRGEEKPPAGDEAPTSEQPTKPTPPEAEKPEDDKDDEDDDTVERDEDLAEKGDDAKLCDDSEWVVLKQDDLKIDLLNLENMDAGGLLAKGKLPAGTYRGIRLMISEAKVSVGDKDATLKIPSGKAAGLKIRAGFEVSENGQVEIDLGFDMARSLRPHKTHGWILKPVLRSKKK